MPSVAEIFVSSVLLILTYQFFVSRLLKEDPKSTTMSSRENSHSSSSSRKPIANPKPQHLRSDSLDDTDADDLLSSNLLGESSRESSKPVESSRPRIPDVSPGPTSRKTSKMSNKQHRLVIAIDFGTTFTGKQDIITQLELRIDMEMKVSHLLLPPDLQRTWRKSASSAIGGNK